MAEILIKAISAVNPDPAKDLRGSYKRGDPVVVMPDGHQWGTEERLPKFVVVRITGLSVDQARKYVLPDLDLSGSIRRKRLYRLLVDDVPNAIKTQLRNTGFVVVSFEQVRNYIENKVTLLRE